MINVGTGNLLLQADDMNVPHKGIALAFRRTYNAQSLHDASGDDGTYPYGTFPSMYGTGWTNTFDAHLARTADGMVWSVFDIDGARYDYSHVPNTYTWTPPAGQHATLTYDGTCGMLWTKKSGTTYYFYRPNASASCPSLAQVGGYAGRLYEIAGRNQNTALTFSYSWLNGDASVMGKIAQIDVSAESGLRATLRFGSTNGLWLLSSLTRPDGTTIGYGYDGAGNLTSVTLPPNNGTPPSFSDGVAPVQTYGYQSSGTRSYLAWAASPRWSSAPGGCSSDLKTGCGAYLLLAYAYGATPTTTSLTELDRYGFMDPTPPDGTGTSIQPLPPGGSAVATAPALSEYYSLGQLGTASTPTFRDSDGHATNWVTDAAGRPTQTQECAATQNHQCTGALLITGETWDNDNNLTAEVDARGYQTDYAYDGNGNAVASAGPLTPMTSGDGSTTTNRPTRLYSYDSFNNVVAYCDEGWTHSTGREWNATGNPGSADNLCPSVPGTASQPGPVVYQYQYPTQQPYGELTSVTSQLGYQRSFGYAAGNADYGQPQSVAGTAFTQNDQSTFREGKSFAYDANGNLTTYGTGSGSWSLAYDAMNRLTSATDPDGIPTRTCYYPDGSPSAKQTALQYALDGTACGSNSLRLAYDLDGNTAAETHHYGNIAGTTQKWYDGSDRLVEVAQPHDATDVQPYAWMTRYAYDISQGGAAGSAPAINGTPVTAYGNLYKTLEYMPPTTTGQPTGLGETPQWVDLRGSAFDALDRATALYEAAFGQSPKRTNQYDGNAQLGLLSQTSNAPGQIDILAYDSMGRKTSDTYTGDGGLTPNRSLAYNARGYVTSIASDLGVQRYAYDAEAHQTRMTEPTGGNVDSPATVTYSYYPNGKRQQVAMASAAFALPVSLSYAYRLDGNVQTESFTNQYSSYPFSLTYTAAGRILQRRDPLTGGTVQGKTGNYDNGVSYSTPTETLSPETSQYDASGNLNQLTIPRNGTYSAFTRDTEGEVTQFSAYGVPSGASADKTESISYTDRGEVLIDSVACPGNTSCTNSTQPAHYFNGFGLSSSSDYRSGQNYGNTNPTQSGVDFHYDTAGRLTNSNSRYLVNSFNPTMVTVPYVRTYDAEDHMRTQKVDAANGPYATSLSPCSGGVARTPAATYPTSMTFSYWPAGRAAVIDDSSDSSNGNGGLSVVTWHWDGDTLLYTSQPDGVGGHDAQVYLGTDATFSIVPGVAAPGIEVYDRDWTGTAVSSHSLSNGTYEYGAWRGQGPSPRIACKTGQPADVYPISSTADPVVATGAASRRSDGYIADVITLQGVRTYDPNAGQWTTPDAYAGDVHDPMSQKPFMWNRNNPFQYSDPSGYDSTSWEITKRPRDTDGGNARKEHKHPGDTNNPLTALEKKISAIFSALYHGGGGTAAAIRSELETRQPTGGSFHLMKGAELLRAIDHSLADKGLSDSARKNLEREKSDLLQAYGPHDPAQFLKSNAPPPAAEKK